MQILLTVCYDGTNYAGWQRQSNAVTVQQKLEEALASLFIPIPDVPFRVRGASRTDAGVHALGQRAAFDIREPFKIPLTKLPAVINAFLPQDVAVTFAQTVRDGFNPRHAKKKAYEYKIYNAEHPNPLVGRYSAFVPRRLDPEAMKKAAGYFIGRHDFKAFCAAGGNGSSGTNNSTVREIFDCRIREEGKMITLSVTGDGFLYNMVRIIAGTVLYAGLGKIAAEDIPAIICSGDRTRAGKTMPPEGLTLIAVEYSKRI